MSNHNELNMDLMLAELNANYNLLFYFQIHSIALHGVNTLYSDVIEHWKHATVIEKCFRPQQQQIYEREREGEKKETD